MVYKQIGSKQYFCLTANKRKQRGILIEITAVQFELILIQNKIESLKISQLYRRV